MSEGDGMATDGDREKAMQIMAWDPLSYEGLAQAVEEGNDPDDRDSLETIDAIAVALAEEREKARAPFLAIADVLEDGATDPDLPGFLRDAYRGVQVAIRRAAEEG